MHKKVAREIPRPAGKSAGLRDDGGDHRIQHSVLTGSFVVNPDILCGMITGAHLLFYSTNPEADRAFCSNVLGFRSVDVGEGWLIFALPPAELAIHPVDEEFSLPHAGHKLLGAVLYLMCDDIKGTIAELKQKKVKCTKLQTARWGISTTIPLPSGAGIGLYQPTHPTALNLRSK